MLFTRSKIQCTTSLEPCDLRIIIGMFYLEAILRAVLVLEGDGKMTARCKLLETSQRDTIVLLYLIIIILVAESKRKHTLLLQIGLVDTGEALGQHAAHVQVQGHQRRVFPAGALTVVMTSQQESAGWS